ncbi:MAG: protein kinase [Alphaproteobacteria bacterium]|nr:protein kinase [Alphaproteobacteria bacterium]
MKRGEGAWPAPGGGAGPSDPGSAETLDPRGPTTLPPDESSDGWVGPSVLARATYDGESIFVPPPGGWDEGAVAELSSRDPAARFTRLELLGRGGMGEVWRVLDTDLNRVIAMKILRGDRTPSRAMMARFVAEAQATAQLEHPGIVPVFELGRLDDGRLYYTMEEIRGRTLADVIGALHAASSPEAWGEALDAGGHTKWSFLRLIDVLIQVCDAVGYAHARGVIHRDLKPTNIMLGEHGEVRVVDWGLVKILTPLPTPLSPGAPDSAPVGLSGASALRPATGVGHVAGTPGFMPPEQARGEVDRLTPAADVYALGAILFAALTGAAPGQVEDVAAALDAWPRTPEALRRLCLAALAADPLARPADASALAEALRAWLDEARSASEAQARAQAAEGHYAAWPPSRRAAARAALLRLVNADEQPTPQPRDALDPEGLEALEAAGLAVVDAGQVRLADPALVQRWARLSGWIQTDRAGQRLRHRLLDAARAWEAAGRPPDALWRGEPLADAQAAGRGQALRWSATEAAFVSASAEAERRRGRARALTVTGVIAALALVSAVAVWGWRDATRARGAEAAARQVAELRTLAARTSQYIAEGRSHAALASLRASIAASPPEDAAPLRAQAAEMAASLGELRVFGVDGRALVSASWAEGGALLRALDGEGTLHTWAVDTGEPQDALALGVTPEVSAWSADGARLAVLGVDGTLRLLSPGGDAPERRLPEPGLVRWLRFTPDGQRLLSLNEQGEIRIWRTEDGAFVGEARSARDRLGGPGWSHVSLSPDGQQLWTRQHPALLVRWSLDDARPLRERPWAGLVWRFAATDSPDLVVLKEPTRMLLWDVAADAIVASFPSNHDASTGLQVSPDGSRVLAAHGDVLVNDLRSGAVLQEVDEHDGDVMHVLYSPDGRLLATAGTDGRVILWDAHTWRHVATLRSQVGAVVGLTFSPDGRRLLAVDEQGQASVWTPQTSLSVEHPRCRVGEYGSLHPDPQGRRMAEGTNSGVCLIDLQAGRATPLEAAGSAHGLGWSPDGAALMTWALDGALRRYDTATGALQATERVAGFLPIQVDARGEVLWVDRSEDPALHRRDPQTGAMREIWPHALPQRDLRWDNGRDVLWARDGDGLALLDLPTGDRVFGHAEGAFSRVALNEPGRAVAGVTADGEVQVFRFGDAEPAQRLRASDGGALVDARFSKDGAWLATLGSRGQVDLYRQADGARAGGFESGAPGSRLVAVGDAGARVVLETPSRGVELWQVGDGTLALRLDHSGGAFGAMLLRDDGLLTDGADGLRTWPAAPGGPQAGIPPRSNLRLCPEGFALTALLPYPTSDSPWADRGCPGGDALSSPGSPPAPGPPPAPGSPR